MTKVLIVEDQADIRKLVRMTLAAIGCDLVEAADGEAGLHLVSAADPDIVLLDVMMPGSIDGLQLCERIKSDPRTRHKAVVLLTARAQQSDIQAGKTAGADEYLTKPFSPIKLIELVESLARASSASARVS
ncbi:MAG: response regulator [Burkholderiales bacterium]